jgi:hypothetical protein
MNEIDPKVENLFVDIMNDIFGSLLGFLQEISGGMIDQAKLGIQHCKLADEDHAKDDRVYAHVGCESGMICISAAMAQDFSGGKLSVHNVKGILLHEIGHILHKKYHKHMLDLLEPTEDPEVCADSTIYTIFKIRIFYDQKKIQWVDLEN